MEKKLVTEAERFLNSRHQNKRRTQVIRGLALLVVFATISALIMPAVTMSNEVECGMEEHIHNEDCYTMQQVAPQPLLTCGAGASGETVLHVHDGWCYDSQGNLVCQLPELEEHTHGPECYQERRSLLCQETADPGHQHSASCYSYVRVENADAVETEPVTAPVTEYVCGTQEGEGAHRHAEECYPEERVAEPLCGLEESAAEYDEATGELTHPGHSHTRECWYQRVHEKLVCTLEEIEPEYDEEGNLVREGHRHGESCWLRGSALCEAEGCRRQESAGHIHTDTCVAQAEPQTTIQVDGQGEQWEKSLICSEEEREPGHVHADGCYEITQVLACRKQELQVHAHDTACYDESGALTCEKTEITAHQHTGDCFTAPSGEPEPAEVLTCGAEEHTHTDLCFVKEKPEVEKFYCGLQAHNHEAKCYFASGAVKCTIPEHAHTEECVTPPSEETEEIIEETVVELNKTFEHIVEPYRMTITVTGPAVARMYGAVMEIDEPSVPMARSPFVSGFLSLFAPFMTASAADVDELEPEAAASDPTAVPDSSEEPSGQGAEEPAAPEVDPSRVEYSVEVLDRSSEEYQRIAARVGSHLSEEERAKLNVFRVIATLDGVRLDLSQCRIEAETELIDDADEAEPFEDGSENGTPEMDSHGDGDGDGTQPDDGYVKPAGMSVRRTVKTARAMGAKMLSSQTEPENSPTVSLEPPSSPEPAEDGDITTYADGEYIVTYSSKSTFKYTVEFYAYLDQIKTVTSGADDTKKIKYLPFIDSTRVSGHLMTNAMEAGKTPLKYLVLETNSEYYNPVDTAGGKNRTTGDTGTVQYMTNLTQLYKDQKNVLFDPAMEGSFTVDSLDGMKYGKDQTEFQGKDHYKLAELWYAQKTVNNGTETIGSWTVYTNNSSAGRPKGDAEIEKTVQTDLNNLRFTNSEDKVNETTLFMNANTVIRMVYEAKESQNVSNNEVTFYDYDITDGEETMGGKKNYYTNDKVITDALNDADPKAINGKESHKGSTYRMYAKGINSSENYDSPETKSMFAFGNNNTRTQLGRETWDGWNLNTANASTYGGCTFGLVTGMVDNNTGRKPTFASDITAPENLFANKNGNGSHYYPNKSLTFERVGDRYTLTSASGPSTTLSNLDQFTYKSNAWKKTTEIWSNNFWPLDNTQNADPWNRAEGVKIGNGASFEANDGGDPVHNAFFGMSFSVGFGLPKDYVGPLEYYFYGDDDMWVFLTGPDNVPKKVCDIGGVHSSVGMYVDLWDYIDKDTRTEDGWYKLTFFYTERGASGSSCWMQYTIPNMYIVPAPKAENTVDLKVSKTVESTLQEDFNKEFTFSLTLTGISNSYEASIYDENNNKVGNSFKVSAGDNTFQLKHGQYFSVKGLPVGEGYTYCFKEESLETGWTATYNTGGEPVVIKNGEGYEGTLSSDAEVEFVNYSPTVSPPGPDGYALPETGGTSRALWYTMACVPLMAVGCLWYKKKTCGEGGEDGA